MNFIKKMSTPAQLLLLATLVAEPGSGQFIVEGESAESSVCGAADCVVISRCSAVLSLVLKVKAGDAAARAQLQELECGFERSLPKVCCRRSGDTETRRVFPSSSSNSSNNNNNNSSEDTETRRVFPSNSNNNNSNNSSSEDTETKTVFPSTQTVTTVVETTPFTTTTTTTTTVTTTVSTTSVKSVIREKNLSPPDFSALNARGCGAVADLATRITLGRTARAGQFPWLAALVYRNGRGGAAVLCGGALISDVHVVTAAHCIQEQAGYRLASVVLGQTDLGQDVAPPGLEVDTAAVATHPAYTQDPVAVNDLAVVKLAAPVPFSPDISPICVAEDGAEGESGAQLTVAGWGRTRHSRQSSLLKFTELAWVPAAECARQYAAAGIPEVAIRASQLCAQGEGGTDSCSGDSGGPLMSQVGNSWFLTGVVSFGTNACDSSLPGVYTRTSSFLAWLRDTLGTL